MQFKITLLSDGKSNIIPINYQYPLSSAIYKIIAKGDTEYANFLHESGYGKGFKLFCFSQISCPFKIDGDRLKLLNSELSFQISFHLPEAMESFVKGLFQSETLDIADQKSKVSFTIKSVESLPNRLSQYKEQELVSVNLTLLSPIVAGLPNQNEKVDFLAPDDARFKDTLIYNWRNKITTVYKENLSKSALLLMEIMPLEKSFKSRLISIKEGTLAETKIRGWMNFKLKLTSERRFIELLLNAGIGSYNAQGMGCVELAIE